MREADRYIFSRVANDPSVDPSIFTITENLGLLVERASSAFKFKTLIRHYMLNRC